MCAAQQEPSFVDQLLSPEVELALNKMLWKRKGTTRISARPGQDMHKGYSTFIELLCAPSGLQKQTRSKFQGRQFVKREETFFFSELAQDL